MKKKVIYYLSSKENTLLKMPKFNGYMVGNGIHGDVKYNRNKQKNFNKKYIFKGL